MRQKNNRIQNGKGCGVINKTNRPRLTHGEMRTLAIIAASVLLICLGLLSPGHNLIYIFSPQPSVSLATPMRYVMNKQGHWQQGDSAYDADSQAKLIVLTNAFYDTSDEDERVIITDLANEIRDNAGRAGDDCLAEDAVVFPLGQKLDVQLSLGELSKAKLLALEQPYIEVQPTDTSQPGIILTTYTFGKIDYVITRTSMNAASAGGTVMKYDVTLTIKAHYNAYVIYSVGWENECLDAVSTLEASGIPAFDIGTASVTSKYKFIDSWNAIDLTPEGLSIPYVIIDTHSTPAALDSNRFFMFSSSITQLQNKHIGHLLILGCNAGHMDYEETNPAASFAKKIYGGFVMASDGTVFNIGADEHGALQYESRDDDAFQSYIGSDGRSSLGWVVYRYVGGRTVTYSLLAYTLTISGILDYFEPVYF